MMFAVQDEVSAKLHNAQLGQDIKGIITPNSEQKNSSYTLYSRFFRYGSIGGFHYVLFDTGPMCFGSDVAKSVHWVCIVCCYAL